MQAIDDLAVEVSHVADVEQSAIKLITGLAAQLAAAGTDPVKLAELQASLTASTDALAAAVATATPAPPPA